jgi:hypothetical protein
MATKEELKTVQASLFDQLQKMADLKDELAIHLGMAPETAPHTPGSETSKAAARKVEPKMANKRGKLLLQMVYRWPDGATHETMIDDLGWAPSTLRTRCSELVEGGYVEDTGKTLPNRFGNQMAVWKPTNRGQLWVRDRTSNKR